VASGQWSVVRRILFLSLFTVYCSLFFAGCSKQVAIVTDARYYEGKINELTELLLKTIPKEKLESKEAKLINKVAIMDFVNSNGKVSALGKYLGSKLSETIIEKNYFNVAQRGEVLDALKNNNIVFTGIMNNETIKKVGERLKVDAVFFGEIVDLGTNIDVNIKFILVKDGEMLSAASIDIERTKSAINLMETY
jgi:TolB-like protein